MPTRTIDSTFEMFYEDDWFGDPWTEPEAVLLIHGFAESGKAWYSWVPELAREYRVLRPDLRGFGRSTFSDPDYPWSISTFVEDLSEFLESLDIGQVHVVGAKMGGTIAYRFASDQPRKTRSLSVVSSPVRTQNTGGDADLSSLRETIEREGLREWAASTMGDRLGSNVDPSMCDWWIDYMASADEDVCLGVAEVVEGMDISDSLSAIRAPSLIFTTEDSALASVSTVNEWQSQLSDSELVVLDGDSYHPAATHPRDCLDHILPFLRDVRTGRSTTEDP